MGGAARAAAEAVTGLSMGEKRKPPGLLDLDREGSQFFAV
jgi:hypothetical protein